MIKFKLTDITPEMAAEWLAHNDPAQRPLNKAHVKSLATMILARKFAETHEAIAFTTDGTLIDGQHRLRAIVQAGVAVRMWVARDVPVQVFEYIGGGKPRALTYQLGVSKYFVGACQSLIVGLLSRTATDQLLVRHTVEVLTPALQAFAPTTRTRPPAEGLARIRAAHLGTFALAVTAGLLAPDAAVAMLDIPAGALRASLAELHATRSGGGSVLNRRIVTELWPAITGRSVGASEPAIAADAYATLETLLP